MLLLATLVHSAAAQDIDGRSTDWPTYMHDNSRAGGSTETLQPPFPGRWVIASAEAPLRAWPGPGGKVIEDLELVHRVRFDDVFRVAIVDGRVFYGSSVDNRIRCIDLQTGDEQWSFVTGAAVRLAPSVANDRVYIGSDDGYAYCLDAQQGRLIWKVRAGPRDERILARGRMVSRWPVRTGILLDDGIAYFGAGTFPHETVYLYAVDAADGEILWRNDEISPQDAGRNDLTPQGYLLAIDLPLQLEVQFGEQGAFYAHNSESFAPADPALPWVFASGAAGLLHCSLPLIGVGEEAATYTVRLYFMSSDEQGRQPQPFAVRLQGRTVIEDLEVSAEADVAHKTLIEEFSEVRVTGSLHIELVPR